MPKLTLSVSFGPKACLRVTVNCEKTGETIQEKYYYYNVARLRAVMNQLVCVLSLHCGVGRKEGEGEGEGGKRRVGGVTRVLSTLSTSPFYV